MAHHIANVHEKLEAAYRRRFSPRGKVRVHVASDTARSAIVTDEITGRKVRYDLTAWRIRYAETVRHGT